MISLTENESLIKPVEDHEVREAVFQMDKFKAPGSDGFGAALFKDYWYVLQHGFCKAVKSFFQEGKLYGK